MSRPIVEFTHKGLFGVLRCPVYLGMPPGSNAPDVSPRSWYWEPYMALAELVERIVAVRARQLDMHGRPAYRLEITGRLPKPLRFIEGDDIHRVL
jgi:hypothetical protein